MKISRERIEQIVGRLHAMTHLGHTAEECHYLNDALDLLAAIDERDEKLAKAVEVLRPFARVGELCEQSGAPVGAYLWTRSSNVPGEKRIEGISIFDVMRARAVLKELE